MCSAAVPTLPVDFRFSMKLTMRAWFSTERATIWPPNFFGRPSSSGSPPDAVIMAGQATTKASSTASSPRTTPAPHPVP